jgi:hypothetical protein
MPADPATLLLNSQLTHTHHLSSIPLSPHEKLMGQVLVPPAHRMSIEFQATTPGEHDALRRLPTLEPGAS